MEIKIEVPDYNPNKGLTCKWEDGFEIETKIDNDAIVITANKQGLISLANHLLNLAQDNVPLGCHYHFDSHNSLEDGSIELIIDKK